MAGKTLESRIHGCLLGSAIGNAMGSLVENWPFERIEKVYGKIEMPLHMDRIRTEDDNRISMLYTSAYLKYRRNITPEDLAEVWTSVGGWDQFFWCMRNAVELLRRGISPRQTGMYNINTGSAIMAIAPVGIYNMFEPDRAYADALDLAYMYQPEPDAQCAAAMAAGFAEAFSPEASVDTIVKAIRDHAQDKDLVYWDDRKVNNIRKSVDIAIDIAEKYKADWWAARKEIVDRLGQWHAIEPIEVLSLVVALFKMTGGNYTEGVIAGTNMGRDSDTVSNLVGGLCGAMHGLEAIPADWREGVQEVSPDVYRKFETAARDFAILLQKKFQAYEHCARLARDMK
ncbi:MAG: ADP-ribosylglycohydrolase family protein [Candidatus Sigynarchaeota archaeon]